MVQQTKINPVKRMIPSFFIPSSIDCKIYPTNQTRRGSRKRPTRRCQRRKRRFDSYVPSISPSGFYLALRSTPWFHLNAIGAPCCCKVSAPTRESAKEIGGPGLGSTPGPARLLKDSGRTQPELRIPGAAAQTRVVCVAGIRLGSGESARAFKGIICDDISEFESYMPGDVKEQDQQIGQLPEIAGAGLYKI